MGADHTRRRRLVRRTALLGTAGVLLAGCASMPSSGEPEPVDASPDKPAVRVFAAPPKDGARAREIVDGFLETLTGNDPDFTIARQYLTADAAKAWAPDRSTTILKEGPKTAVQTPPQGEPQHENDMKSITYELSGRRVARLDADHAYRPESGAVRYEADIHLVKEGSQGNEQWRIATPPEGVVLGELDFQRLYRPVDKYYFASKTFRGERSSRPQPLVADSVYVRGDPDPQLTDVVEALLAGPTKWLDPVVYSRFPSGTALRKGTKDLSSDDQKHLRIPLNKKVDDLRQERCKEMAAQIYFTLENLATPSGIEQVELLRSDESSLCVLDRSQARTVAPDPVGNPEYQYYIDKQHRLVRMQKNRLDRMPVPGELGEGKQQLSSAAVSHDEDWAAGVSRDGTSLFVGALKDGAQAEKSKVTSSAAKEGDRLAPPSWDGRGDLWVADQNPEDPRLLWLNDGKGTPLEVGFDRPLGVEGEGRITTVRVAADGVRIALLMEKDGKKELKVGRIVRSTSKDGALRLSVAELRPAAPKMAEVTAVSWAGGSRLLVIGKAVGGVQQMRFVQSDGSRPPEAPTLPGLTGARAVAAAERPELPLVARSEEDGIVRLVEGEDWKPVDKDGVAPVYPG
ncbi:LpqB family beta-propeller domain-containing protein [Streptomyces sp. KLOTTS4A1]|uniref:LpqB family beta-propeller domain-containing protein n=1 Tax=Streptomyces sp. KLOTTS4A1 TaxID=3390996 RepID=UPI0039F4FA3E